MLNIIMEELNPWDTTDIVRCVFYYQNYQVYLGREQMTRLIIFSDCMIVPLTLSIGLKIPVVTVSEEAVLTSWLEQHLGSFNQRSMILFWTKALLLAHSLSMLQKTERIKLLYQFLQQNN